MPQDWRGTGGRSFSCRLHTDAAAPRAARAGEVERPSEGGAHLGANVSGSFDPVALCHVGEPEPWVPVPA